MLLTWWALDFKAQVRELAGYVRHRSSALAEFSTPLGRVQRFPERLWEVVKLSG